MLLCSTTRHCPAFAREGQFLPGPLALGKQADRVGAEKRLGQIEQPVERRQARAVTTSTACGGTAAMRQGRIVTVAAATRAASRRKAALRESASTSSTPATPRIASTRPGKPGAAAEIDQALRAVGNERPQLRRIEKVAAPQIGERVAADEIDARRPSGQQLGIGLEPRQCFT